MCLYWTRQPICSHVHQLKRSPKYPTTFAANYLNKVNTIILFIRPQPLRKKHRGSLVTLQLTTTVTSGRPRSGWCCHLVGWETHISTLIGWWAGRGASTCSVCWLLTFLAHSNNTSSKPLFAEFNVLDLWMKAWRNAHSAIGTGGCLPATAVCLLV